MSKWAEFGFSLWENYLPHVHEDLYGEGIIIPMNSTMTTPEETESSEDEDDSYKGYGVFTIT